MSVPQDFFGDQGVQDLLFGFTFLARRLFAEEVGGDVDEDLEELVAVERFLASLLVAIRAYCSLLEAPLQGLLVDDGVAQDPALLAETDEVLDCNRWVGMRLARIVNKHCVEVFEVLSEHIFDRSEIL